METPHTDSVGPDGAERIRLGGHDCLLWHGSHAISVNGGTLNFTDSKGAPHTNTPIPAGTLIAFNGGTAGDPTADVTVPS
jgi:hypothetical protein